MTKSRGFIDFGDDPLDDITPAPSKDGKTFIAQGKRCYHSHPALKLGKGTLIGGNCQDHKGHAAQLYVALDSYHKHPLYDLNTPPPHCIYYPIPNMKIPTRVDKFKGMIACIVHVLEQGGTVHVGCIGGHGRTGLVIAAVVATMGISEDNDPIGWTRANYCMKAMETKEQEGFIVVNFGAKPQPGTKTPYQVDKSNWGR